MDESEYLNTMKSKDHVAIEGATRAVESLREAFKEPREEDREGDDYRPNIYDAVESLRNVFVPMDDADYAGEDDVAAPTFYEQVAGMRSQISRLAEAVEAQTEMLGKLYDLFSIRGYRS